jgi:hypothetical protein
MTEQTRLFEETIAPYSPSAQNLLGALRKLVLSTVCDLNGMAEITEALRCGQFSFLTLETGSGSTIRLGGKHKAANAVAMFFRCQSGLVDHFREIYGKSLKFEGKRAIVLMLTPMCRKQPSAIAFHLRSPIIYAKFLTQAGS